MTRNKANTDTEKRGKTCTLSDILPDCEGRRQECGEEANKRGENECESPACISLELREMKGEGAKHRA